MTTKTPTPVAVLFSEGDGALVTKTHDVQAALDALLALFVADGYPDDEALEAIEPYLENAPILEYGRWVWSSQFGERMRFWRAADPSGRGVTRAVKWVF